MAALLPERSGAMRTSFEAGGTAALRSAVAPAAGGIEYASKTDNREGKVFPLQITLPVPAELVSGEMMLCWTLPLASTKARTALLR